MDTRLIRGQRAPTQVLRGPVEQFLSFMETSRGAADNTVSAYRNDLYQIANLITEWFGETSWSSLNKEIINDIIAHLQQQGYKNTSIARKTAVLRSFFNYLVAEGIVTENLTTEDIHRPRVTKVLPKTIGSYLISKLLEQVSRRSTPKAVRDRAMIELLCATGMRVTELVSLDVSYINLGFFNPYVHCPGKGAHNRIIPLHDQAIKPLVDYLGIRNVLARDKTETALFVNHHGRRLTRQGFWLILKGYAKLVGLDEITPYTLRHSFATSMLKGGMPLRNVQEMLGHASVSTTRIYARYNRSAHATYTNAHPRAV